MTGEGAVERSPASRTRKRGEHRGQGAEKRRQEMLPEIPNEVSRDRVGNTRRRDPLAKKGLVGARKACQYRASLPADLPSLHPRQTLTFSATLNPWVPLPAPHPNRMDGGGSFTLTLPVGLLQRATDTALIRGPKGQETQGGPGPE